MLWNLLSMSFYQERFEKLHNLSKEFSRLIFVFPPARLRRFMKINDVIFGRKTKSSMVI